MIRCKWPVGMLMINYHDEEWGIPVHNDKKLFEYLVLENLQCGLSWSIIMNKRSIIRDAFANFDYDLVCNFTENDVLKILNMDKMIKSKSKILAVINNAKMFKKIISKYGSFDNYIWHFSCGKVVCYLNHHTASTPFTAFSNLVAKDLKKEEFKYIGATTIYSYLQACGIVNDHDKECFMYKYVIDNFEIVYFNSDDFLL